MQTQLTSDPVLDTARLSQDGWITRLYRFQVWLYLLLGALPLLVTLSLFFFTGGENALGLGILLMYVGPLYLGLVIANVIALRSPSSLGWWLHFLSIFLGPTVLANAVARYLISPNVGLEWGFSLPLLLLSLGIAVAAKRALFGKIGIAVPLVVITLLAAGALYSAQSQENTAKDFVAELKPVAELQGQVVFANPELDQALGSSYHSMIRLPDLPSKEYYQSFMDVRYNSTPLTLPDGQFYQVWLADAKRSSYHPVSSFVVVDGSVNQVGGPGFIAYDHATLKIERFPVVVLSKETLSIDEINADMKPGEYSYYQGRKQSKPTNVIFEGTFAKVDHTTQDLFNSIVDVEDQVNLTQ